MRKREEPSTKGRSVATHTTLVVVDAYNAEAVKMRILARG